MTLKRHLGIFGIDAHATPNITSPFGDASLNWLFGDVPGSIVRYMHDASAGLIDISGGEHFGFGVVTDPAVVAKLSAPTRRDISAQTALSVALGMGAGDLLRFDGLVFVIRGVQVNAGATSVNLDGHTIQAAIFDDLGPHCFMSHELGHVVGLDHSFKLSFDPNPNHYLYGEYGDATDIMSAMTYGNRRCTFVMSAAPGSDVAADAHFWGTCGPGISPATLWRFLPGFPALPPWALKLDPAAPGTTVTLKAAGHLGTTLAVLPWPGLGGGWWTIEYRPARGWDQGLVLEDGDHANAPGVVIHIIRDIGSGLEDPSYPRRQRVTYEATIPVPSAGDDDWTAGAFFGVRVVNATAAEATLLVGQLSGQTGASLRLDATEGAPKSSPAPPEWVPLAGRDCKGASYAMQRDETRVEVTVTLDTVGFELPLFTLTVNGHDLPEADGSTSSPPGVFTVEVDVMVPTGRFTTITQHRAIQIGWRRSANTVALELPPGDGAWTLHVAASVREGGIMTPAAAAEQSIDITTASIGLTPQAAADLARCLQSLVAGLNVHRVPPVGMPTPPGPVDGPDWSWLQGPSLVHALAHLRSLERRFPKSARELRSDVAAGLKVFAQELRWLEDQLPV